MCYSVIPILLYTGIPHIEWRVILKMSVCFSPGLVRRQWRVSGFPPSSSPPTLNGSRSLWTRSDSQTTGHWLNSRKTRRGGHVKAVKPCRVRDRVRELMTSPFFPWAILSCNAALKGATPVPGPTMITGVSSSGNLKVPFFTHRGTCTSPETAFSGSNQTSTSLPRVAMTSG